jgi:hypothetical protein
MTDSLKELLLSLPPCQFVANILIIHLSIDVFNIFSISRRKSGFLRKKCGFVRLFIDFCGFCRYNIIRKNHKGV